MARALLIVDVQNDFLPPDGALAVPGGDEVIEPINALAASGAFDLVVATRDRHPPDHSSFEEAGGPWPPHCVAGTRGAELHPRLDAAAIDAVVDKGTGREGPGYSGFEAPELAPLLRERAIDAVTIAGVAADYCVRHTALDALRAGLAVTVAADAVRGIDAAATARTLEELRAAGAEIG